MISLPRSLSPNPSRKEASRQQDHREEDFGVNPPTPGRARPGSLPPAAPPRLPAGPGSAHLAPHVPVPVAIAVAVAVPVADSALRQPYLCPTSQRAREAERGGTGWDGTGRGGRRGRGGGGGEGEGKGRKGKEEGREAEGWGPAEGLELKDKGGKCCCWAGGGSGRLVCVPQGTR